MIASDPMRRGPAALGRFGDGAAGERPRGRGRPGTRPHRLWTAKRRFGPDAVGRLIVTRSGDSFVATWPVGRSRSDRGGRTRLRPSRRPRRLPRRIEGGAIRGRWVRPARPQFGAYASPVVLRAERPGRWSERSRHCGRIHLHWRCAPARLLARRGAAQREPIRARSGAPRRSPRRRGGAADGAARRRPRARARTASVTMPRAGPSRRFRAGGTYDFTRDGDDSDIIRAGAIPAR